MDSVSAASRFEAVISPEYGNLTNNHMKHLLHTKYHCKSFTNINSLSSHHLPGRRYLLQTPSYRWGAWGRKSWVPCQVLSRRGQQREPVLSATSLTTTAWPPTVVSQRPHPQRSLEGEQQTPVSKFSGFSLNLVSKLSWGLLGSQSCHN